MFLFGAQPAEDALEADLWDAGCWPPLRGGCGPPTSNKVDFVQDKPAAERTGLRRRGAALRQGAAAGCGAHSGAIKNEE